MGQRDSEIKAAPSVGLEVVGFVEQIATATGIPLRRSPKISISFQSK